MGVSADKRSDADRERHVKPCRAGNPKSGYLSISLIVPSPIIREVADESDTIAAWEQWRNYEFEVELTDEGLLYRPLRVRQERGW